MKLLTTTVPSKEKVGILTVIGGSERAVSLSEPFVQYVTRTLEVRLKEKRRERESERGSCHRAPLTLSPTRNMMRHEMDEASEKKDRLLQKRGGLFQAAIRGGK